MDEAAIRLVDVGFSYGKKPFIADFTLDIAAGAVTSIVGPNGCGKSTLLKIVDGILVPAAGEVLIGGQPCHSMGSKQRARHVALLPQGSRPPTMTVEGLVACGRYPHQSGLGNRLNADDRRHVEEAMALAGVEQFRHMDVRFLSGGERQRVFIAMVLAQDTEIIVMDEPTTYLDMHACHEIMQLTRTLNEVSSKTIVMVNHDIDLALRYSDRIAVMDKGSLLYSGDVPAVLASGTLEEAFHVEICPYPSNTRTGYTIFPR